MKIHHYELQVKQNSHSEWDTIDIATSLAEAKRRFPAWSHHFSNNYHKIQAVEVTRKVIPMPK